MSEPAASAAVVLPEAEPNGIAAVLRDLIEQNLERRPERLRLLHRPASFSLSAPDVGLAATLRVEGGAATITNGAHPSADVSIRADSLTLLELSSVPLRFGLPDVTTREGRAILGKQFGKRLKIRGLLRHTGKVAQLAELLSVH